MPTHVPPPRTLEQNAAARATGLSYRRARSKVKQSLRDGEITLDSLLTTGHRGIGDPVLGRIRIGQLLNSVPLWGNVRVAELLEQISVDPRKHVDQLSQDKVDAILLAVAEGPQRRT